MLQEDAIRGEATSYVCTWMWAANEERRDTRMPMGKVALPPSAQPTARLGKLPHKLCGANTQPEGWLTSRYSQSKEHFSAFQWLLIRSLYITPNRIPPSPPANPHKGHKHIQKRKLCFWAPMLIRGGRESGLLAFLHYAET